MFLALVLSLKNFPEAVQIGYLIGNIHKSKPLKNCAYINERAYNPNIKYNRVACKYHVYLKKGPGFSHLKF